MKRRNTLAAWLAITALTLGIAWPAVSRTAVPRQLSDQKITELRAAYPIHFQEPAFATMRKTDLNEVKALMDTFVYGKIVGRIKPYSEKVSAGIDAIDLKNASLGGLNEQSFFGYTVEVLQDSEGLLKKGQVIAVEANTLFSDALPELEEGMLMVIPVTDWSAEEHPDRFNFIKTGLYYVTDEGYTLSAFEETVGPKLTGYRVSHTLEVLKKD